MIMAIYQRALAILMKKPFRLWGISLLGTFLTGLAGMAFGIIPVVGIAIGLLFEVSLTMILLRGYRGEVENPRAVDLFETFKDWATIKRVLCGMGWMILWIFLWALIPIVGWIFAIIRTYEYRLTPYILMQEPDVKPTEAIKLSKERTKGWKGKMFWADVLVFVFFYVALLILGLLSRIPYAGVLFAIIMVVVFIVFCLFITLFTGLVQAAFYEEINKWGAYPGREAYAAPRQPRAPKQPKGPQQFQGYDPQQGYPPQGYPQQPPQGYPPQYAPPQGYDPYAQQPPQGYPPQFTPQPPQGYDPYAQPQQYAPPQPDIPQPNFPPSEPPVYPQPDFPPQPQAPEAPDLPQE